jgi:hypothetical protein
MQKQKNDKLRHIILALLLSCISVFGWLRLSGVMQLYGYLIQLGITPHPLYYVLSGLMTGLLFLTAIFVWVLKVSWGGKFILISAILFGSLLMLETLITDINRPDWGKILAGVLIPAIVFFLTPGEKRGEANNESEATKGN